MYAPRKTANQAKGNRAGEQVKTKAEKSLTSK